MNIKMKRILLIAGSALLCIALVVLIGSRFITEKPDDNIDNVQESPPTDVYVGDIDDNEIVVAPPEINNAGGTDNGAKSTGTEQTIQGDAEKPTYSDEQLKDQTQKPDGERVTTTPTPVDHNQVTTPEPTAPSGGQPGQIYMPGFGWIDDHGGGSQQVDVGSDGDINKQVGDMG